MKQRGLIILIFVLVLLSIAGVGASDADDISLTSSAGMSDGDIVSDYINVQSGNDRLDDVISVNEIDSNDSLAVSNENAVLGDSFNDLQSLIDDADGKLDLDSSYFRDPYSPKDIDISKNITIDGHGYTIDGNGGLIINIAEDNITVTLKNITFANGLADGGGAIQNARKTSSLTIINCEFLKNSAENIHAVGGGPGGAIYSKGKLTVIGSYFYENSAAYSGGAIYCNNILLVNNTVFR